jgi:5'-nucleotidase
MAVASVALVPAAQAAPDGTQVVISEAYGGGGNSGGVFDSDFVELRNPTNASINLGGLYLHAGSTSGSSYGAPLALSGTIPAHGYWLVKAATGTTTSQPDLPTPDQTTTWAMGGSGFRVSLQTSSSVISVSGHVTGNPAIVDYLGVGAASAYEGAAAGSTANGTSVQRNATGADTDNNAADFTVASPTPQNSGSTGNPDPDPEPGTNATIEEIQGTGTTSPRVGRTVTTTGIVTGSYPTGGLSGFYLQQPNGTDPNASDSVFVFKTAGPSWDIPAVGDQVTVTGAVSEYFGLTELTGSSVGKTGTGTITPVTVPYPTTDAAREALEGMLVRFTGDFTVTDNYNVNRFGEISLAAGDRPLWQPTEVADAQNPAAIAAVVADNASKRLTLDDGSSTDYMSSIATKNIPLPWLTNGGPIRVGAPAHIQQPMILDYRFDLWRLQPITALTGSSALPVTFGNTRTEHPAPVGGEVKIATFNVLNYFPTTGQDYVNSGHSCSFYNDRAGNPIAVNDCGSTGPRGAANAVNLDRQEKKIVAAINGLGADVVSLEELENTAHYGPNRDAAISRLVDALNAAAGAGTWAYVATPPGFVFAGTDVIRNGFIYKPAAVQPVGESRILDVPAFDSAREPLAQVFKQAGGADNTKFIVITNHFKSKSSGADAGDGQGPSNADRVNQARALVDFATGLKAEAGTDVVFLAGDINSYSSEDPIQVLEAAGYTDIRKALIPNEYTYLFDGLVGSLDHVLGNEAAMKWVTGADVWNINTVEPIALEYSRYNYNATDFYAPDPYRSSDHDPLLVGLNLPDPAPTDAKLNLVGINDFHGRIDANTVKWAGTVEQLRAAGGQDNTVFVGAGDLIGASLFESASADDQPTLDVLNALGLDASAVGNHEFDKGWDFLRDKVIGGADGFHAADFAYLGANVYQKGTKAPVLPEYASFDRAGLKVCVIGAVTQETSTLVSPGGITTIDFGDPIEAINRVAVAIDDTCDVTVATMHAGAIHNETDPGFEDEANQDTEFGRAVRELDPDVDAFFQAHTHKVYTYDAPVPGHPGKTRPFLQTGEYGNNVGQVSLTVDLATHEVTAYTQQIVPRTTVADSELVAAYPRVAAVKQIVDNAIAQAAVIGNQPKATITSDITTATSGGSFVNGVWTGGSRDDRASESTLGNLVADALVGALNKPEYGNATIGVVNPGGLRADLLHAGNTATNPANTNGVVTYAEANAVLPFVNNLWTVTLTGDEFRQVLEQQWQPASSSRPFLQLGLSDNVRTTLDPSKPAGQRVTSVYVDGKPLDPNAEYKIATFSFLGTGGDNFTAFTKGTSVDTGLVDRDAWISYLQQNSPLQPSYDRRQAYIAGPAQVVGGLTSTYTVSKAALTSLGTPQPTGVSAALVSGSTTTQLATFPVAADGTATVTISPTWDIPAGSKVVLTVAPAGTTVTIPAVAGTPTVPAWSPAKVYNTGDRVSYQGKIWEALWYSKNDAPDSRKVGAWQEIATAADGTAIWTTTRVFNAGDTVIHQGKVWKALWYSRNDAPGAKNGPWQEWAGAQDGNAIWTQTRVFNAGDKAWYEGKLYIAQWYARGEVPGKKNGPWKLV